MDASLVLKQIIPLAGMVVGIIAIMLPAVIVFIALYYRHQRTEKLYDTVRQLVEKGLPVPPELLDPPAPQRSAKNNSPLFNAVTLIGAGLGLALMFHWMELRWLIGVGAMLVCIGAAQLLALAIERRWADKA